MFRFYGGQTLTTAYYLSPTAETWRTDGFSVILPDGLALTHLPSRTTPN